MFEGDIEVTPEQMERLQKGTNEFGSIIGRRWPNGRIPYKIESSIGKFYKNYRSQPSEPLGCAFHLS